jgi:hypothetical protein
LLPRPVCGRDCVGDQAAASPLTCGRALRHDTITRSPWTPSPLVERSSHDRDADVAVVRGRSRTAGITTTAVAPRARADTNSGLHPRIAKHLLVAKSKTDVPNLAYARARDRSRSSTPCYRREARLRRRPLDEPPPGSGDRSWWAVRVMTEDRSRYVNPEVWGSRRPGRVPFATTRPPS